LRVVRVAAQEIVEIGGGQRRIRRRGEQALQILPWIEQDERQADKGCQQRDQPEGRQPRALRGLGS